MSERKTIKFSDLPNIRSLPERQMLRAKDLFEQAIAIRNIQEEYGKELDVIIGQLEEVQQEFTLPGIKASIEGVEWGFASQTVVGRRTLDKILLMERAGVTKKMLDACMKTGKESTRRTLRKVGDKEESYGDY